MATNKFLEKTVAEFSAQHPKGELVAFTKSTTVARALAKMTERNVHAAPVLSETGALLGFVDCRDIMTTAVTSSLANSRAGDVHWSHLEKLLATRGAAEEDFSQRRVYECMNASEADSLVTMGANDSMARVMGAMLKGRIHRIAVAAVNPERTHQQVERIISASDMIGFIGENAHQWSDKLGAMPISKVAHTDPASVVSVRDTSQTINAFQLMYDKRISAVAVVDANGVLVANLSSADLRGAGAETASFIPSTIFLSVREFLQKRAMTRKAQPPITVPPDAPLERVVASMAMHRVHRVWIVDKDGRPQGLVTAFDIFKVFE